MNIRDMTKTKIYCNNCGRAGHLFKNCKQPITSYGLLGVYINENTKMLNQFMKNKYISNNNLGSNRLDILKTNNSNLKNLGEIKKYINKIKFLLISRKKSLGYIEFMRGKYELNDIDKIIYLFEQMTTDEIDDIKNKSFDELWLDLWQKTAKKKLYRNEFLRSREKFNKLENKNNFNLTYFAENIKPKFKTKEWGIPKGRRDRFESKLNCAIREFNEETGYSDNDYVLLKDIKPLVENLIGTNGVKYRHVYYLALFNNEPIINENINNREVGELKWVSRNDASMVIRKYHKNKKKIINETFLFMVNNIIEFNDQRDKYIDICDDETDDIIQDNNTLQIVNRSNEEYNY